MKIAAVLVVVVFIASLALVSASVGASVAAPEEDRKFINVKTIDKFRDDLVGKTTASFLAANETDGATASIPCYPVPYSFCAGCAMGCSNTCYYTGTYDMCVATCMSWPGWAPHTKVSITYFPYGQFSTGGCVCSGSKCDY